MPAHARAAHARVIVLPVEIQFLQSFPASPGRKAVEADFEGLFARMAGGIPAQAKAYILDTVCLTVVHVHKVRMPLFIARHVLKDPVQGVRGNRHIHARYNGFLKGTPVAWVWNGLS